LIWTFFMSSTEKLPLLVAIGFLASSSFDIRRLGSHRVDKTLSDTA